MDTTLEIIGNPTSQKRHRHTRWGTYDPSSKDKKQFIDYITSSYNLKNFPTDEPLDLTMWFYMKRPKSHYGTGRNCDVLKKNHPTMHTKKPDIDNLIKFVLDAGNGLLWKDDSVVVNITAYKRYSNNKNPRTLIKIL